jgi:hypothetical protein
MEDCNSRQTVTIQDVAIITQNQLFDTTCVFDGHGQIVAFHSYENRPVASDRQLCRMQQMDEKLFTGWA